MQRSLTRCHTRASDKHEAKSKSLDVKEIPRGSAKPFREASGDASR
jgi:hypothetical protein